MIFFLKTLFFGTMGIFLLILLISIGWIIIWNSILYKIPILREILGLEEPINKYNKNFTLDYKL